MITTIATASVAGTRRSGQVVVGVAHNQTRHRLQHRRQQQALRRRALAVGAPPAACRRALAVGRFAAGRFAAGRRAALRCRALGGASPQGGACRRALGGTSLWAHLLPRAAGLQGAGLGGTSLWAHLLPRAAGLQGAGRRFTAWRRLLDGASLQGAC